MVLLDGDTDRQDEKYEVVRCWQKNGSFYLFQVSQDEDYPNDYGEEYEGEDYEEGEYEDDYGGDYEGDYDEEYEGDYDEQESEGGDEDYYDYDYEENKSEDAEDEGSDDYSDYDYDDEDAVNEEDLTESETEVVDIGSSSSSSGNGETSDTAGQVEPLDGTEKTPEVKLTQSGEQEIEATIDVDEVDDVIEDYFEAAYDELAEDGSSATEDSFGSEESESESLNTESQHEDKKQNEVDIITDDEDFTDGSGEEMEEHEPSSTTMSSTTSTTLTTSTTTTTRTTISTSTPAFPTPIKSHTPTINTFDDEDHRSSGDDDEDDEKEGSGVASHPVSVPPNFVTDDEDYDDEEEGSSPQVANHCPFHSHHGSLYEGGPWRPDRGGVDGLDHWRGQQDQEDLLWYPRGVAVRNQDKDKDNANPDSSPRWTFCRWTPLAWKTSQKDPGISLLSSPSSHKHAIHPVEGLAHHIECTGHCTSALHDRHDYSQQHCLHRHHLRQAIPALLWQGEERRDHGLWRDQSLRIPHGHHIRWGPVVIARSQIFIIAINFTLKSTRSPKSLRWQPGALQVPARPPVGQWQSFFSLLL